ncbi:hypothetical protein FQR65_LT11749 [Abscondita terminalis]|nr:hypothetical protein FQR65_LT11749 [Abscondita terminalis]
MNKRCLFYCPLQNVVKLKLNHETQQDATNIVDDKTKYNIDCFEDALRESVSTNTENMSEPNHSSQPIASASVSLELLGKERRLLNPNLFSNPAMEMVRIMRQTAEMRIERRNKIKPGIYFDSSFGRSRHDYKVFYYDDPNFNYLQALHLANDSTHDEHIDDTDHDPNLSEKQGVSYVSDDIVNVNRNSLDNAQEIHNRLHKKKNGNSFMEFYELGDISAELDLRYNLWKKNDLAGDKLKNIEEAAFLEEANIFCPCKKACTPYFEWL